MMHGIIMFPPARHHNTLSVLRLLSSTAKEKKWQTRRECDPRNGNKVGSEVLLYLHSHRKIYSLLPIKRYKFPRIINPFLACMNTISKWNCAHKYTRRCRNEPPSLPDFFKCSMIFHKAFIRAFLFCVCFYYVLDRIEI